MQHNMKSSSLIWPSARNARLATALISVIAVYAIIFSGMGRGPFASRTTAGRVTWADARGAGDRLGKDAPQNMESEATMADFARVSNRTLGFEKVIAIGLPERSDKRDALDLMAALSDFDIDWVDGVKATSMSEKAIPFGINISQVHDNFLGSWRSHMNAIRQIVDTGVSSALIMEDDMDWDVYLKLQLNDIAHGARQIHAESSRRPKSPYGDTWDVLWLGHCGEPFPETLEENSDLDDETKARISTKYTIKEDDTVPPYSQVSHLVDWSAFPPHTRLVHQTAAPICSFAYAISQSAARRILYAMSVDGLHMAFDNSLAQLCRDAIYDIGRQKEGGYRFRCLSVNPTIMFHHKAKGLMAADSDIQSYGTGGDVRDKGISEAIKWSMRLNLRNILTGQALESQFAEED